MSFSAVSRDELFTNDESSGCMKKSCCKMGKNFSFIISCFNRIHNQVFPVFLTTGKKRLPASAPAHENNYLWLLDFSPDQVHSFPLQGHSLEVRFYFKYYKKKLKSVIQPKKGS